MRNEREANAALSQQVKGDEAFRDEARRKLAPNPAARHQIKQARHVMAAKKGPGLFIRTLKALRGRR
jgi:hypothetical protein